MSETFKPGAARALFFSTTAFAVSFAVWGLVAALAPTFTQEYGLSAKAKSLLIAMPVLLGSFGRLPAGMLADRFGGRRVFAALLYVFVAVAVFGLLMGCPFMLTFTVGALGAAAALGLGNGAIFKLVPEHFPKETGTVTGLVGAFGGLGGFFPRSCSASYATPRATTGRDSSCSPSSLPPVWRSTTSSSRAPRAASDHRRSLSATKDFRGLDAISRCEPMKVNDTNARRAHARLKDFIGRLSALVTIAAFASLVSFAQTTTETAARLTVNTSEVEAGVKESTLPAASKPAAPQPPKQRKIGGVNFSGSLRLRVENYGWFETPGFDDDYTFGAATLRLSLGQQKERYDWQVEGEFPVLVNLPERAVAIAPQGQLGLGASYFAANGRRDASAVLKQAYVRVKGIFGDKASAVRAGRFEFVDGAETTPSDATLAALKRDHIAHRLIGHFGFSHVGRSFDAVQYVRNTKSGNFTFVGGRPTEGVFQLRSLKELDVDFWYGAYTKPLASKRTASEFRLLALHYHDGRGALKTDNRSVALRRADAENIRLTTFGGNYIAAVKTARGTVDLLAWGVGQFGRWGNLDHRAGAVVFEGGFQPGGNLGSKLKPWLRAGYSRSTGDGDPADARHTTFFQPLPTARIYARFPFYNMMNNEDIYAQLKLKPHARLALRADVHHLRLSNRHDLWYTGGGAFQEGTFGYAGRPGGGRRGMGTLFDLSADVSVTPTTTLTFYGAGVRGGSVQSVIYPAGGASPAARFFYAELTKRF